MMLMMLLYRIITVIVIAAISVNPVHKSFEINADQLSLPVNETRLKKLLQMHLPAVLYTLRGNFLTFNPNPNQTPSETAVFSIKAEWNQSDEIMIALNPLTLDDLLARDTSELKQLNLLSFVQNSINPFAPNAFSSPLIASIIDISTIAENKSIKEKEIWKLQGKSLDFYSDQDHLLQFHSLKRNKDLLIVFTTSNHLDMTIRTLQFMDFHANPASKADLIIIDDFSIDGTVEYLRKKGYAVFSKSRASGLTDSWNLGYRLASSLKYKYVFFMNNDVLLTKGSVDLIEEALHDHAFVIPMTTDKGAGHNPLQVG